MGSRTVLIGYGETGRAAADVSFVDLAPSELVVVDTDPDCLDQAVERGATARPPSSPCCVNRCGVTWPSIWALIR